jgi:cobalt-precorrin-5B (C1)-methyltransferase
MVWPRTNENPREKKNITMRSSERFDLTQRAENGLKRGFTTGACATAAVKAALLKLLCNESPSEVDILLPGGTHCLTVPIEQIAIEKDGAVRAVVIKDAGDDPDQTHRARIFARVARNRTGRIVFLAGEGVGVVTQPGLRVAVGEPAINPVPRQMMIEAVHEILGEGDAEEEPGFDLEIGCENGEQIARRTFNPRLGIQGGISILGTTGIVEPKSKAAFTASIEVYVRVALGDRPQQIVLAPGNLGQQFARSFLDVPVKRVVQMSNFIGFTLECVQRALAENRYILPKLWLVGHPGKLAKVLDDVWDTHSSNSRSAVEAVLRVADEFGIDNELRDSIGSSRTVEGIIELLRHELSSRPFWRLVERKIESKVGTPLDRVDQICVRLFQMDGKALGGGE